MLVAAHYDLNIDVGPLLQNSEIQQLRKEIERQKENLSSLDNKAKWAQNRLKSELEAHKVSTEMNVP